MMLIRKMNVVMMIVLIMNSNCFSLDRKSDDAKKVHPSSETNKAASPSSSLGGVDTGPLGVSAGEANLSGRGLLSSSSSFSFGSSLSLGANIKNGHVSTIAKNHQESLQKSNIHGKKKCHSSSETKEYKNGKLVRTKLGGSKCPKTNHSSKKRALLGLSRGSIFGF